MDADLKKIKKLTAFMRKQGVLKLKTPEVELELSPGALLSDEDTPNAPTPGPERGPAITPSADDLALGLPAGTSDRLFWSSPGVLPDEAPN